MNGRPPKTPVFTPQDAIYKAFYKQMEVTQNGKIVKKPLIEIFAESVVKDAIKKDGPSRKLLLKDQKFINHDFMKPLIDEALENLPDKPNSELDEKMERFILEAIAKLLKDEDLE